VLVPYGVFHLSSDDFCLDGSLVQGLIHVAFKLWQMVCAMLGLYTPCWCWYRCPKIGTSSIDWGQLSRFYLKMKTESSLRKVMFWNMKRTVFLDKKRTMDNVQKHNICIYQTIWRHIPEDSNIDLRTSNLI
jgi:hypothetical protein